jgi:hypothetical protein
MIQQFTFSRKELYDLVWSKSLLSLSRLYAISDNGLRKICFRLNIPLPKSGHWKKVKAGKFVKTSKLLIMEGINESITLSKREEGDLKYGNDNPIKQLKKEIEADKNINLLVSDRFYSNDKRILKARDSFRDRNRYINNGLINTGRDEFDIKVSPENVSRALRFMDTLIKALDVRGHSVSVGSDTYVLVKDERMKIILRERLRIGEKKEKWGGHNYIPTGLLYFRLDSYPQKEWMDGKLPIEGQLADIIARLEIQGSEMLASQIKWRKQRLEQEEKDRIRKEFEERKKQDLVKFKNTLNMSKRWHKAVNLRLYLDTIEQKATNEGSMNTELIDWLKWARKKADWYDPFIEQEDELLEDVDREKLTINEPSIHSWD